MERELVARAKKGDHQAFLELLEQHDRQLMSVVCRFTGDRFDREDLYQDIFMHCFKSIARYRSASSFKTWLYRLAMNRCLAYARKKEPVVQEVERGESFDWEQRQKLAAIHRAMKRLSGRQRICFHLFYIEDWNTAEIAELLKAGEGTIKSHLERARQKIKRDQEVWVWQPNAS